MEKLGIKWTAVIKNISELKHWDKNPRSISDVAYARLRDKIKLEGMHQVLTINIDGTVLSGNQRFDILKELGIKEVWCMVPERELNELECDKVGLQSNIIEGMWDSELLLKNFELPLLLDQGLTRLEIGSKEPREDNFDVKKELDKIVNPISQIGDIYQLGDHKIMCGDSTNEEHVSKLFGDEKATMIFTSPPYNMNAGMYKGEYKDDKSREEYIAFNLNVINLWKRFLKGFIFWNISYNKNSRDSFIEIMYKIIYETGLKFLELVVWNKKHALPITSKSMLTRLYEDVLVVGEEDTVKLDIDFYFAGTNEKKAVFNKRTGKALTNYWEIGTNNSQVDEHLACFPVLLPAKGIQLMTMFNDIVADPFVGTGTTIIASEQLGRKCYAMEMSPLFVDIAIKRFISFRPVTNTKCLNRDVDMVLFK